MKRIKTFSNENRRKEQSFNCSQGRSFERDVKGDLVRRDLG